ncbi:hypothetical protein, partial [Alistipes ihumii]
MKAMLILLFGYLFLERFLFRGSLGRLFVQGWRRLLRNGWDALSRALRLPAGRRASCSHRSSVRSPTFLHL